MSITYGGDNITFPDGSTQNTSPQTGFVNRIINGDMRIDQRNAGAAVTASTTSGAFPVDRFVGLASDGTGTFTLQQSTTAPAGFKNAIIATVGTTFTPSGSNQYNIRHNIEGLNVSDLGWGTANAQAVTLSFWVRSSITGTYGGSLSNSAFNRSYPFTFVINSANTYEYKTITVAGDTSGTWLTDTGIGIRLCISLGAGSTLQGTAGAWGAAAYTSATGATNWISNAGATFYITGVSLVKGSTALPWEFRSYGQERALCYRYYQTLTGYLNVQNGYVVSLPVLMRVTPTATTTGGASATRLYPSSFHWNNGNGPAQEVTSTFSSEL